MKKQFLLLAFILLSGSALFIGIKSVQHNRSAQKPSTSVSVDSSTVQETQAVKTEKDEDEDYTKVVINPVQNITANQEAQLVASADLLKSCGYTRETTEGPYYVSGSQALINGNLNYDNLPGTPLVISGYVYGGEDNSTPLANAQIEIWHTDDSGAYHPQANGPASNYTDEQLSLRGYVTTDKNGYYSFSTIYPGEYSGRARHIHVRASVAGYQTIVSQIIMSLPGDKMSASADNIARALDSTCSAPSITNVNGTDKGFYNFWLQK